MPSPFALVGHSAKWDALRRAFASDRIPQSLMISGPAHVGKWTLARAWAQLLLCPNAHDNIVDGLPAPCETCRACHQVEVETFPDLRVVRPIINKSSPQRAPEALDSSMIPIEEARRFVEEAAYRPTVGDRKAMLIYQADRLGEEAQNALLKTLEEPGTGVKITLITDRPLELLPTIRSRCWQLRLGMAPAREIEEWLRQSFPGLSQSRLASAARLGAGRPGIAWRQAERELQAQGDGAPRTSRAEQVHKLIERVQHAPSWGFLALSESAQKLAELWGEEDAIARVEDSSSASGSGAGADDKKLARTLVRSQLARFLDELAQGYRARWIGSLVAAERAGSESGGGTKASSWALGLDRIGKTRHYILRNANASLAFDVLFSQLVQDLVQDQAPKPHAPPQAKPVLRAVGRRE